MTFADRVPPLEDALLREIAAQGGVKRYPARAVIINEGDDADSLYVVLSGRVKVYTANAAGRELVLTTLGPGEYLGEMALDGGVRSASVMTLEPTTCAVVSGASLREFVARHPDFAQHLILSLIRRVRRLTGSARSLALEDVYGRLAALLREQAGADGTLAEKLTQQDIGERIGASREMVSRVMKELTAGGYVTSRGGRLVLLKTLPAAW